MGHRCPRSHEALGLEDVRRKSTSSCSAMPGPSRPMKTVIVGTAGHRPRKVSSSPPHGVHRTACAKRDAGSRSTSPSLQLKRGPLLVDVPGAAVPSRRAAGAAGIDLASGGRRRRISRPQTRDTSRSAASGSLTGGHALTKIDIADPELAALAASEVRDAVRDLLESAPWCR
jgi:hypothetical protein